VLAALLAGCGSDEPAPTAAEYVNEAYGFVVSYPGQHTLVEHSPRAAVVGRTGGGAFEPLVEIVVESGDSHSRDAFLRERALAACDADGPAGSVECTAVLDRQPVTSLGGVEGERFHLRQRTSRPATGELVGEAERGPVYAFPLRNGLTGDRFVMVMVRAPLGVDPGDEDDELVSLVAVTLRLTSAWVLR
jgi:hypothetical protein